MLDVVPPDWVSLAGGADAGHLRRVSVPGADHVELPSERIAVQRQMPVSSAQNDDLAHGFTHGD